MNEEKLNALFDKYIPLFRAGALNCAESTALIMADYFDRPADALPRMATALGGGLSGIHSTCGVLTAGMLAVGLVKGREIGGDKTPAYQAGRAFYEWFVKENPSDMCRVLIDFDPADPQFEVKFRAPGGKHDTVCIELVKKVCRHLVQNLK